MFPLMNNLNKDFYVLINKPLYIHNIELAIIKGYLFKINTCRKIMTISNIRQNSNIHKFTDTDVILIAEAIFANI